MSEEDAQREVEGTGLQQLEFEPGEGQDLHTYTLQKLVQLSND